MQNQRTLAELLELEQFKLLVDRPPFIAQHFKSLEGEGGNNAIGVTTLFLRLNKCNCSCTFCDTSFSIPGDPKYNICRADTTDLNTLLSKEYSPKDREYIHSCSITGGEPLLHLKSFSKIIDQITTVFPNIDHLIIETNGNLLANEDTALEFLKLAVSHPNINFTLSISPKLDAKVSYASKLTDDEVKLLYSNVFINYKKYLSKNVQIQCKFVHSEELSDDNEWLINYILRGEYIEPRTKLLIMPFTPPVGHPEFEQVWKKSKDDAAKYALKHYLRYSPRIHIDRGME